MHLGCFLGKIELRFRIKLRFMMNLRFRMKLCPKLHMLLCLFGLSRPSLEVSKKKIKKAETDNYYSCVALRAATKKLKRTTTIQG